MSMLFKRIKDWAVSITSFRTGDVLPVDGPSGTAKMTYSDLAKEVIKDSANNTVATEADLVAGSKIPIMTANGPKSLPGNTIAKAREQVALTTYSQNVAHSLAPEFDPTRDSEHAYKAGESVTYTDGKTYTFKVDHYGAWSASDVYADGDLFNLSKATDKKLLLKPWFEKAANLHYEYTKFVDGTGVVYDSDRLGSGLIAVSEGDIVSCTSAKPWYSVFGVAANGKTLVSLPFGLSKIIPSGCAFVFIQYSQPLGGSGLETEVKIIRGNSDYRLQYNDLGGAPNISAINKKFIINEVFNKVSDLYYESSKFVDGTGVVQESNRVSSGLVPVGEGDVFYFRGTLHVLYLVAADGKTGVSIPSGYYQSSERLEIPSGVSYVFISYRNGPTGSGVATEVKRLLANDVKYDVVNNGGFVSGGASDGGLTIDASCCRLPLSVKAGVFYKLSVPSTSSNVIYRVVYEKTGGSYEIGPSRFVAGSDFVRVWVMLKKSDSSNWDSVEIKEASVDVSVDMDVVDRAIDNASSIRAIDNSVQTKADYNVFADKSIGNRDVLAKIVKDMDTVKSLIAQGAGFSVPANVSQDSITDLDGREKKLIVNLHKMSQGSYSKENDVYLPYASGTFGDVAFFDQNGKQIKYSLVSSCEGFDVVPDSRLKFTYKAFKNTHSQIFGQTKENYQTGNKFVLSEDNGVTWTEISVFSNVSIHKNVCILTKDDTLLVNTGTGQIYRSEYPYTTATMVLDTTVESGVSERVTSEQCCQASNGDVFLATYQDDDGKSIIYKSTDDGETWTIVKRVTDYQHVHRITAYDIDGVPTIYVGCDVGLTGRGTYYKSSDLGSTWEDVGLTYNLGGGIDHGVIYCEDDVRYIGGESSYKGVRATSILRTSDDETFENVFSNGKPVYDIVKVSGRYFICSVSEPPFQTTELLISDDLKSFKSFLVTAPSESTAASGGFHTLSKIGDEVWVYNRNDYDYYKGANKRILFGQDKCFAQVVLYLDDGVTSVTARTGYALPNRVALENESKDDGHLFYAPLNEKSKYTEVFFNGERTCFESDYGWSQRGRRFANFTPPERLFSDDFAAVIDKANDLWFDIGSALENGGYHIGMWLGSSDGSYIDLNVGLTIVEDATKKLNFEMHRIYARPSGSYIDAISLRSYQDTMIRLDINVDDELNLTVYVNGNKKASSIVAPAFSGKVKFLSNFGSTKLAIQHFAVDAGTLTDSEIMRRYYGDLEDLTHSFDE